jgi:hypothetical protein
MVDRMPGRSMDAIRNKLEPLRRRAVQREEPVVVYPTVLKTEFVQHQENCGLPPVNAAEAFLEQSSRKVMDERQNECSLAFVEAVEPTILE